MTDLKEVSEEAVDRDAMIANVMLYWQAGTAGSSARLYRFSATRISKEVPIPGGTRAER